MGAQYSDNAEINKNSVPAPGRDLILQIMPGSEAIAARQLQNAPSGYLDSSGQLQTSCQNASVFTLRGGRLFSDGNQLSVSRSVPSSRFRPSQNIEAIDQTFGVAAADDTLRWVNPDFEGGAARFCADSNATLHTVFFGSLPSTCSPVSALGLDRELSFGFQRLGKNG